MLAMTSLKSIQKIKLSGKKDKLKSINGVGVGYREAHSDYILENKPHIEWFEILTDSYLDQGGPHIEKVFKLRRDYPLAMHGIWLIHWLE